jgi:hypothetical protein
MQQSGLHKQLLPPLAAAVSGALQLLAASVRRAQRGHRLAQRRLDAARRLQRQPHAALQHRRRQEVHQRAGQPQAEAGVQRRRLLLAVAVPVALRQPPPLLLVLLLHEQLQRR